MISKLFSKEEQDLLIKAEKTNSDELFYWRMPNVIYPFLVIFISLISFYIFKPDEKFSWAGLVNIIINGSLPMVALNRMSSIGGNLFKYDKEKELKLNTNTTELRTKIDDYSKILILLIALLYIYQVINTPFILSGWIFLQVIISIIFIRFSLKFSKYAFLLQERLIERTIADDIKDAASKTKKHLSEKYGNQG